MTLLEPPYELNTERMFLSEYERSLDRKGRFTLPVAFREELGDDGAILTRGFDKCLFLFPRDFFEAWRLQIRTLPITDPNGRALRRLIFSSAAEVTPDGQGRIILPQFLRQYAGIDSAVIVAGLDSYIEIWDAQQWALTRSQLEASAANPEAWRQLGI